MIKVNFIDVFGWDAAIRGMRNSYMSWAGSDSYFFNDDKTDIKLGEKDLSLMKKLILSGFDHSKFMRMIHVQFDVEAPLYWWKQFDTYKIGTTVNSTSTMHSIMKKKLTKEDFSFNSDSFNGMIDEYNKLINAYNEEHDELYFNILISLLPSGYNQLRTVDTNYQVLRNIYHSRKNHKLKEWSDFCNFIKMLPYGDDLLTI